MIRRIPKDISKVIELSYGELFCGPGGLALGAMRAQYRKGDTLYRFAHSWSSDYDIDSCNTYRTNICPDNLDSVICSDVREINTGILPPTDVFVYGFPCNDFSLVGEQKGFNGKFGPLYAHGVKIIDESKPKFFVAENVGGIRSADKGRALRTILSDLENAGNGYNITTHFYKFEEYGIPQTRHRMFMVGVDRSLDTKFQVPCAPKNLGDISSKTAITTPPIQQDAFNNERTRQSEMVIKRLQHIRPGENAWQTDLPEELRLNVPRARLSHIYKRLHPDKPAYTITGSGGGGTHVYHWEEPRALTNRERARLQTFPDSFQFMGSKESVRKQIGMAVSPKMSQIIFKAILKTFVQEKYDTTTPNYVDSSQLQVAL